MIYKRRREFDFCSLSITIWLQKGKLFSSICVRYTLTDSVVVFFRKLCSGIAWLSQEYVCMLKSNATFYTSMSLSKCNFKGFSSHYMIRSKALLTVKCVFSHHAQTDKKIYFIYIYWYCGCFCLGFFILVSQVYFSINWNSFLICFSQRSKHDYKLRPWPTGRRLEKQGPVAFNFLMSE